MCYQIRCVLENSSQSMNLCQRQPSEGTATLICEAPGVISVNSTRGECREQGQGKKEKDNHILDITSRFNNLLILSLLFGNSIATCCYLLPPCHLFKFSFFFFPNPNTCLMFSREQSKCQLFFLSSLPQSLQLRSSPALYLRDGRMDFDTRIYLGQFFNNTFKKSLTK